MTALFCIPRSIERLMESSKPIEQYATIRWKRCKRLIILKRCVWSVVMLNLAQKYEKKKQSKQTQVPTLSRPVSRSTKAVRMQSEKLWRRGFVTQTNFKSEYKTEGATDGESGGEDC